MRTQWGYACVGSHGGIFVTDITSHDGMRNRFQIYDSWEAARKNAYSDEEVVKVKISEARL